MVYQTDETNLRQCDCCGLDSSCREVAYGYFGEHEESQYLCDECNPELETCATCGAHTDECRRVATDYILQCEKCLEE